MRTLRLSLAIVTALVLLAVVPAVADVFQVHLKNGNSFETRYKPKIAGWDENKIVVLTDIGNRITLHKDDVVDITHDTDVRGFGTVIDTTTIVLGWAPNDAPTDQSVDPAAEWAKYLQELNKPQSFNVDQFVSTEAAGQQGGGLPAWDFGPGAYGGRNEPVVIGAPPVRGPGPGAGAPEARPGPGVVEAGPPQ